MGRVTIGWEEAKGKKSGEFSVFVVLFGAWAGYIKAMYVYGVHMAYTWTESVCEREREKER